MKRLIFAVAVVAALGFITFRAYAQKVYLASDEAKEWPKGMLEKINALK